MRSGFQYCYADSVFLVRKICLQAIRDNYNEGSRAKCILNGNRLALKIVFYRKSIVRFYVRRQLFQPPPFPYLVRESRVSGGGGLVSRKSQNTIINFFRRIQFYANFSLYPNEKYPGSIITCFSNRFRVVDGEFGFGKPSPSNTAVKFGQKRNNNSVGFRWTGRPTITIDVHLAIPNGNVTILFVILFWIQI